MGLLSWLIGACGALQPQYEHINYVDGRPLKRLPDDPWYACTKHRGHKGHHETIRGGQFWASWPDKPPGTLIIATAACASITAVQSYGAPVAQAGEARCSDADALCDERKQDVNATVAMLPSMTRPGGSR